MAYILLVDIETHRDVGAVDAEQPGERGLLDTEFFDLAVSLSDIAAAIASIRVLGPDTGNPAVIVDGLYVGIPCVWN